MVREIKKSMSIFCEHEYFGERTAIKKLAEKIGIDVTFYGYGTEPLLLTIDNDSMPITRKDAKQLRNDLSLLMDHFGLEMFEGREIRKKVKIIKE